LLRAGAITAGIGSYECQGTHVTITKHSKLYAGFSGYEIESPGVSLVRGCWIDAENCGYSADLINCGYFRIYVLTEDICSCTISGSGVLPAKHSRIYQSSGSYSSFGSTLSFLRNYVVRAFTAEYDVGGIALRYLRKYVLSASQDQYNVLGSDACLLKTILIVLSSGQQSVQGSGITFLKDYVISSSFVQVDSNCEYLVPQAARIIDAYSNAYSWRIDFVIPARGYMVHSATGVYRTSGFPTSLMKNSCIDADSTSISSIGSTSRLLRWMRIFASNASYNVSGLPVNAIQNFAILADPISENVYGWFAGYTKDSILRAYSGSCYTTGGAISSTWMHRIPAWAGSYKTTGSALDGMAKWIFDQAGDSYTITGSPARGISARRIYFEPGIYGLYGVAEALNKHSIIQIDPGINSAYGWFSTLRRTGVLAALSQSYDISSIPASLTCARRLRTSPIICRAIGSTSNILANRIIYPTASAYTIAGIPIGAISSRINYADAGTYNLSKYDGILNKHSILYLTPCDNFAIGESSNVLRHSAALCENCVYDASGFDADRILIARLNPELISVVSDLLVDNLAAWRQLYAQGSDYNLTWQDASLLRRLMLNPEISRCNIVKIPADLTKDSIIDILGGEHDLLISSAVLRKHLLKDIAIDFAGIMARSDMFDGSIRRDYLGQGQISRWVRLKP